MGSGSLEDLDGVDDALNGGTEKGWGAQKAPAVP